MTHEHGKLIGFFCLQVARFDVRRRGERQVVLRRHGDADGVDPLVHRHDRLRRHLLRRRRHRPRRHEDVGPRTPHRLAPHDRYVLLLCHVCSLQPAKAQDLWLDDSYSREGLVFFPFRFAFLMFRITWDWGGMAQKSGPIDSVPVESFPFFPTQNDETPDSATSLNSSKAFPSSSSSVQQNNREKKFLTKPAYPSGSSQTFSLVDQVHNVKCLELISKGKKNNKILAKTDLNGRWQPGLTTKRRKGVDSRFSTPFHSSVAKTRRFFSSSPFFLLGRVGGDGCGRTSQNSRRRVEKWRLTCLLFCFSFTRWTYGGKKLRFVIFLETSFHLDSANATRLGGWPRSRALIGP